MEMRIVVAEPASASALARRLSVRFGSEQISVWGRSREVDVRIEEDSDGALLHVLDTVWGWLDHAVGGSAEVRLGERSYTLAV